MIDKNVLIISAASIASYADILRARHVIFGGRLRDEAKETTASNEFSDFWPQYSTLFITVLFDLRQVSSLIVCHVFRVSPENLSKAWPD